MQKNAYRLIISVAMASTLIACTSNEPSLSLHWKNWANTQADSWLKNAAQLLEVNSNYCTGSAGIDSAQSTFTQNLSQWAYINGYPYKAIDEQALSFSLYFWPDKRNMTEIRLGARAETAEPLSSDAYDQLIAAEKGIPAIEWLLYKEDMTLAQRCSTLVAVSEVYLADVTALYEYHQAAPVILDEWATDSEVIAGRSIALNLLYAQISRLESHLRQSRDDEGLWISYMAEGWRSENTWLVYSQSLTSLTEMLEHTGQTSTILPENKTRLEAYILDAKGVLAGFYKLTAHQQNPEALDDLQVLLVELANFLENSLAENFGILIGFNNFDGD
jgi:predicted lipoprotein|tara:strand:+ start:8765 stop:9757 length:993 start_codon:yes stop_codon:yes gene_type:complete